MIIYILISNEFDNGYFTEVNSGIVLDEEQAKKWVQEQQEKFKESNEWTYFSYQAWEVDENNSRKLYEQPYEGE